MSVRRPAEAVTAALCALTCDDAVVRVWERLVVTVEAVLLVDDDDVVQGRWAQPSPQPPALRLYDALVLAGAPLTSDRDRAWAIGRPEWIELRAAVTHDEVLAVLGDGAVVPLNRRLTDAVLDFYRRYLDGDAS